MKYEITVVLADDTTNATKYHATVVDALGPLTAAFIAGVKMLGEGDITGTEFVLAIQTLGEDNIPYREMTP